MDGKEEEVLWKAIESVTVLLASKGKRVDWNGICEVRW